MLRKYWFLFSFALIHPRLALLAWRLKRDRLTYLGYWHLFSLARNYFTVRSRNDRPVRLAEFGVGRGGSATLLAWLVGRYGGTLSLYDVFGQIPAPSDIDGARAQDRYRHIIHGEGSDYYGNLPDLVTRIRSELAAVCSADMVRFVQGPYEETLADDVCEPYDLVHVDCDWYESVRVVVEFLETHTAPGAVIQIDDYSNWQGSRIAVDEAEWLRPYHRQLVGGPLVIDTGRVSA